MQSETLTQLINRIQTYGWAIVLLELTIIGSVVYIVLRFLRGTRGARVIKGIALILIAATTAVQLLGDTLLLERLNVLYQQLLAILTLGLIVIFQPELRRALMRLGTARLFFERTRRTARVVDEIISSIDYLSRNKIGALVALERQVGLGGIVEAGTEIDARITRELLDTIFWPGTALHDMGVVIRDNRIMAAGVQFPLADSEQVTQEMGSRHRAALGLSQESDALVIVVSEETGTVSLAERGHLSRNVPLEKLRHMLAEGLEEAGEGQADLAKRTAARREAKAAATGDAKPAPEAPASKAQVKASQSNDPAEPTSAVSTSESAGPK